jgi:hypothetical protein
MDRSLVRNYNGLMVEKNGGKAAARLPRSK